MHIDDIEKLNASLGELELFATKEPAEARATGAVPLRERRPRRRPGRAIGIDPEGVCLVLVDTWARRQTLDLGDGLSLALPSIDDLITTKRWGSRPKDMIDIQ